MSGKELLMSPKVGHAIATSTMGSGAATILELIPADIGKLATLLGVVLSVVLIVIHVRRHLLDSRKARLEIEILKKQLAGTLPPAAR